MFYNVTLLIIYILHHWVYSKSFMMIPLGFQKFEKQQQLCVLTIPNQPYSSSSCLLDNAILDFVLIKTFFAHMVHPCEWNISFFRHLTITQYVLEIELFNQNINKNSALAWFVTNWIHDLNQTTINILIHLTGKFEDCSSILM